MHPLLVNGGIEIEPGADGRRFERNPGDRAHPASHRRALGVRYPSNALAQEKTGWAWVGEQIVGGIASGDFEHCDVALIVGTNPWPPSAAA